MGFTLDISVPIITVFSQGIISFFSPCVVPLLPVYMGYLAGGNFEKDKNGLLYYDKKKVLKNTVFFVLGISFAFFILGLGVNALGAFFSNNRMWFARISGIIMVVFGLFQFGFLGKSAFLMKEHRLPFKLHKSGINAISALLLGFTFSFAWTPCIGPTMSSVLLMASSSASSAKGFILIGVYTLGFILPFLILALFTTKVLNFIKQHTKIMLYTVKIGAVLLIVMGVMTFTGLMNGFSQYLTVNQNENKQSDNSVVSSQIENDNNTTSTDSTVEEMQEEPDAPAFVLYDQFGNTHTLADYKGKVVFLNFWATWCPPCRGEMPDIQKLYETNNMNKDDVVILGVAAPNIGGEGSEADVIAFLESNGLDFPVVMDTTGEIFEKYGIQAYPTTFMIDKDGKVFGYVQGAISYSIMENIVQQTIEQKRA